MLSDVLADTIQEIRAYQNMAPEIYGPHTAQIDDLVLRMEALQVFFDRSPDMPEH